MPTLQNSLTFHPAVVNLRAKQNAAAEQLHPAESNKTSPIVGLGSAVDNELAAKEAASIKDKYDLSDSAHSYFQASLGNVGFATPKVSPSDAVGSILQGIAAVAALLGPEFIHSLEGTKWLEVGETAIAVLGKLL